MTVDDKKKILLARIGFIVTIITVALQFKGVINSDSILLKIINTTLLLNFVYLLNLGLRYHASYELNPKARPFKMIKNGPDWDSFLKRYRKLMILPALMLGSILQYIWVH